MVNSEEEIIMLPDLKKEQTASSKRPPYSYSLAADVFRRIGLDERDHMNTSFRFCDKPECVVNYDGMPEENRPEPF